MTELRQSIEPRHGISQSGVVWSLPLSAAFTGLARELMLGLGVVGIGGFFTPGRSRDSNLKSVLVCQTSQESKRIMSPIWSEHEGNPVSTAITNHVPKRRSLRCQRTLETVKCERILSAALSDEVKEKQNGCQPAQLSAHPRGRAPKRRSEEARNPSIKTGSDVCSHRRCEQLVWCQLASFRTHRQWQAKSPGCSSVTETLTQSHRRCCPRCWQSRCAQPGPHRPFAAEIYVS